MVRRLCLALVLFSASAYVVQAGIHHTKETYGPLPAQWGGFLLDHRTLRNIAPNALVGETTPIRQRYLQDAESFQLRAKTQKLTADEIADWGASLLRLGETTKALEVLRNGLAEFPRHFSLQANLGSAWHLAGDFRLAERHLEEAVRLAPGKWQPAEELHLRLVRDRTKRKNSPSANSLDDLFGVPWLASPFQPGKIASQDHKKLPSKAVGLVQQLALWFPADGLLLWQLAELANAHGDAKTAAAMMEGCVVQFGISHPELRRHRQILRTFLEESAKDSMLAKSLHADGHQPLLTFRSRRPLAGPWFASPLPEIRETGPNAVPWDVFAETTVESPFRPRFAPFLTALDGKEVTLAGFMQPLQEDAPTTSFLFIEFPVGCWFCEMPGTANIVQVELGGGQTTTFRRGLQRVTGQLRLNREDPEQFLYSVRTAKIGTLD